MGGLGKTTAFVAATSGHPGVLHVVEVPASTLQRSVLLRTWVACNAVPAVR
jgi:hypothetical protein